MVKLRAITKTVVIFTAISVFAYASTVYARSVNDGLGRTGYTWLKTFSDAGLSASGECFAARDGLPGILVHPAAIAGFNSRAVKMSYVSHYVDTQYGSIGYAGSFKGRDAAIRFTYVNYGEFNGRDSNNESTGTFSAGDFGVTLNLGKKVRDDLKVGVMASFMSSKIEDFSSQAASLDFGAIYEPPFEGLTVGAALMNVGTVIKGYSSSYKDILPTYLSVGARKQLAHAPVTLFTDVIFPNDNDIVYAYGIEIAVRDMFYINAGTKSRSNVDKEMQESSTDFFGRKSFGFGIDLKNYRFNYAFCPDDELEDIHKITLTAKLK